MSCTSVLSAHTPVVDHGLPQEQTSGPRKRPDLSTFYSNLGQMDDRSNNTPTLPHPTQMAATARMLANNYQAMLGEMEGIHVDEDSHVPSADIDPQVLRHMLEQMMDIANHPPDHTQGVPDDFMAKLERVPKAELQKMAKQSRNDTCPICGNAFLEDQYPLVVRLPCHQDHLFDHECIEPWLKFNVTCPLDRQKLVKVETQQERIERITGRGSRPSAQQGNGAGQANDEEEDDMDGMYG